MPVHLPARDHPLQIVSQEVHFMNEDLLKTIVSYFVRLTELGAIIIIFSGTLISFWQYIVLSFKKSDPHPFSKIRLNLGRFLVLGLEFQLASDLLRTAVAPSFVEIGKLAAIATIRTILNYFLTKEIAATKQEFIS